MSYQEEHGGHARSRLAAVRRRLPWRAHALLPAPLTSFVGRSQEVAALTARLAETRLLTLTGIGGIGKSRLALEVARLADGAASDDVYLVELAAIAEPAGVIPAVASALGVQQTGSRSLLDGLVATLSGRDVLLLLDNCEHVAEATANLTLDLLQQCPALRVLATSRIPLDVHGEAVWRVEPLAVPDPARLPSRSALTRYAAVRLFVDRARAARSEFRLTEQNAADVVHIAARLDGIPLAIELAAARVGVLSPHQIVQRLDDRFRLLTSESRSALPRHRTLRALIDWSYDLLDEREQILIRRLAVFAGGWSLDAAEAVCSGDGVDADDVLDLLARLVAKSLVLADHARGEARFGLLETIREYALGLLRHSGEEHDLRQRHLVWVLALAQQSDVQLWTSEQRGWLARLDAELDNIRTALAWSTGPGDAEHGLRIAGCLWRFWEQRGHAGEARRWLNTLLERPGAGPTSARAMALECSVYFAHLTGDFAAADAFSKEALVMARAVGDPPALVCALLSQGILVGTSGDLVGCQAVLSEALAVAREADWQPGIRMALMDLGVLRRMTGAIDEALALLEEGRAICEAAGDSYALGFYLTNLAHLDLHLGNADVAAGRTRHALAIWRDFQDTHNVAMALETLAWAVGAQRRPEQSARLLGAAEGLRELVGTALLPHWQSDHDRACATAQQALGERVFAAAWARGRAMSVEQAIDYGLAPSPGRRPEGDRVAGARDGAPRPVLSRREAQIARLVAQGLTNRKIAEQLVLQESTVGNHLQRIYARLGLNGRAQLATWLSDHAPDTPGHALGTWSS
jgi:predicted ATPase/DNA-binding CsgD family transcriptional regulator